MNINMEDIKSAIIDLIEDNKENCEMPSYDEGGYDAVLDKFLISIIHCCIILTRNNTLNVHHNLFIFFDVIMNFFTAKHRGQWLNQSEGESRMAILGR